MKYYGGWVYIVIIALIGGKQSAVEQGSEVHYVCTKILHQPMMPLSTVAGLPIFPES